VIEADDFLGKREYYIANRGSKDIWVKVSWTMTFNGKDEEFKKEVFVTPDRPVSVIDCDSGKDVKILSERKADD
jgi:hypothetical protein